MRLEARDAFGEVPRRPVHRLGPGEPGRVHRAVREAEAVPDFVHHRPDEVIRQPRERVRSDRGPSIEIARTEMDVTTGHPATGVLDVGSGEGPTRNSVQRGEPDGVDPVAGPALIVRDRFLFQHDREVGRLDLGPGAEAALHALAPERGVHSGKVRQILVFEEPETQRKLRGFAADRPRYRGNSQQPAVPREEPVAVCGRRLPPQSQQREGDPGPARTHGSDDMASPPDLG